MPNSTDNGVLCLGQIVKLFSVSVLPIVKMGLGILAGAPGPNYL